MKENKCRNVFLIRQSLFHSILADLYTFCSLGVAFWWNYKYINGSYLVNFLILLFAFVILRKHLQSSPDLKIYKVKEETMTDVVAFIQLIQKGEQ